MKMKVIKIKMKMTKKMVNLMTQMTMMKKIKMTRTLLLNNKFRKKI